MSTTKKWVIAVIAAAVIGGVTVASRQTPSLTTQRTENCTIKGNISSSGAKIYHVQGQRYYDQTKINTSAGERWFCTEQEATGAGWRKSKV